MEVIDKPCRIAGEDARAREGAWRWWVLATLFLATFINYFDRQTLGSAIDPIAREFGLDNVRRGDLLAAFMVTYALTHLVIGAIIDRVRSVRWFFPVMVVGWSVSTMLVGLARSYHQLLGLRYLLGVWEAVNFPICIMIIARIFPARERSLASGIFASGAFLATLTAPYIVIYCSSHFNWRLSFVGAGVLGLLWVIPWFIIFRRPEARSETWREAAAAQALHHGSSTSTLAGALSSFRIMPRCGGPFARDGTASRKSFRTTRSTPACCAIRRRWPIF